LYKNLNYLGFCNFVAHVEGTWRVEDYEKKIGARSTFGHV
jgi:hypothetical protein